MTDEAIKLKGMLMSDDGGVLEFSNNESAMRCMAILVDIQKSVRDLALSLARLERRVSRIDGDEQ